MTMNSDTEQKRSAEKSEFSRKPFHKSVYALLFSLLILVSSCGIFGSDDEPDDPLSQLSPDIREFVTVEMLAVLEDSLHIPVHTGENPPDIAMLLSGAQKIGPDDAVTNSFIPAVVMRPFVLLETVVPNDRCANDRCTYNDLYVRFSNQNLADNQIDIEMRHAHQPEHGGTGAFIIGDGDQVSIFAEQVQEREEGRFVHTVILYSGIVTTGGIKDPHLGTIMVDNAGFDELIPNGTGQSHGDGNGFSEIAEWPEDPVDKIAADPLSETDRIYLNLLQ